MFNLFNFKPKRQTIEVLCGDGNKIEVSVDEDVKGLRKKPFQMIVADSFNIKGRGTVLLGKIEAGYITKGDKIYVNNNPQAELVVAGIEIFREIRNYAEFGESVGVLVPNDPQCKAGDIITKEIKG